jgi:hypothetical protein
VPSARIAARSNTSQPKGALWPSHSGPPSCENARSRTFSAMVSSSSHNGVGTRSLRNSRTAITDAMSAGAAAGTSQGQRARTAALNVAARSRHHDRSSVSPLQPSIVQEIAASNAAPMSAASNGLPVSRDDTRRIPTSKRKPPVSPTTPAHITQAAVRIRRARRINISEEPLRVHRGRATPVYHRADPLGSSAAILRPIAPSRWARLFRISA